MIPSAVPGAYPGRNSYRRHVVETHHIAGPRLLGKAAVAKQIIRHFLPEKKIAYLKIDVVRAFEDEELKAEFNIPAKEVYSRDLCPDQPGNHGPAGRS